jgi:tRNA G46 methylase TrmB
VAHGNSRSITTNQVGIHEKLVDLVEKYQRSQNLRPVAAHSHTAFAHMREWLGDWQGSLILDNCCGVGASTATIAKQHPDAKVIGIDKSALRIEKHSHYAAKSDNYLLVRADLHDIWRLARDAGWQCSKQYLLYPNPYPKSAQVQKRWHGSPAFLDMLALGGDLLMRSNWQLYLQEAQAVLALLGKQATLSAVTDPNPLTPFEAKYQDSGQQCWELVCILS